MLKGQSKHTVKGIWQLKCLTLSCEYLVKIYVTVHRYKIVLGAIIYLQL